MLNAILIEDLPDNITNNNNSSSGSSQNLASKETEEQDHAVVVAEGKSSNQDVDCNTAGTGQEDDKTLMGLFVLMVVIGSANKIFSKLQTIPMYNYPNSMNLLTTFMYIPLCFAYILPAASVWKKGNNRGEYLISKEQYEMSKWPFFVMGILDCMASLMGTFAAVYLPGPLLVLLPQASIPISMILSRHYLNESYAVHQYAGAIVVVFGIFFVLSPELSSTGNADSSFECVAYDVENYCILCTDETSKSACLGVTSESGQELCEWTNSSNSNSDSESSNNSVLIWSAILILSCIPGTLSSIYKEKALGSETSLDPVFLNGWIAVFQFLFSIVLAVPAGLATEPPVEPENLLQNLWDGFKCYFGHGSIDTGCHPDDHCAGEAPLFVNLYLAFNIVYNLLMVLILKYGSTNILYLAMTVMVPIGNLAFALPFMPEPSTLHVADILGLAIIMAGLSFYRFGDGLSQKFQYKMNSQESESDGSDQDMIIFNDEDETNGDSLRESLLPQGI